MPGDLIPCSLFLIGILTSVAADFRLRRVDAAPWANGCITVAGAALVFAACAAAIR
ncbi:MULTISPECIES: hypothetical protein [unclassified Methylobacterium]|jgi:hypothetical protein|uniref:hypothetical protein n=1 Tax=unclassified Methylobacterium TaxID=2615210 RepID=UPI001FB9DA05|nr:MULTISPECIES: hypothetical protein [unclassified Methylobacterium]MCJ2021596.1 hypothetical protein [Methylobacterium sp. E-065]